MKVIESNKIYINLNMLIVYNRKMPCYSSKRKKRKAIVFFSINYETLGEWGNDISRNTLINTPLLAEVSLINEHSEHCYFK